LANLLFWERERECEARSEGEKKTARRLSLSTPLSPIFCGATTPNLNNSLETSPQFMSHTQPRNDDNTHRTNCKVYRRRTNKKRAGSSGIVIIYCFVPPIIIKLQKKRPSRIVFCTNTEFFIHATTSSSSTRIKQRNLPPYGSTKQQHITKHPWIFIIGQTRFL
jgi:hypothetical protein